MADLNEEVRRRRTAAALLNGGDDDSEEEDTPSAEQNTEADTAALADEEAADQGAADQEEPTAAPAEKAPSLGYRFVPVTPPTQNVPQNVPRGTYPTIAEDQTGAPTPPPATTAAAPEPEYAGIAESAPDTLTQVERGELVKPPVEPAPDTLPQVERAELVKPPAEAPSTLPQVERGELVKVPPGTAPRAVAVPSPPAVKPTEPVTQGDVRLPAPGEPAAVQMPVRRGVPGQEAVQMPVRTEPVGPPAVKPAESAVPPVPTAEYTDRVQKWQAAMRAYGFDAKVKPDGTWIGVDAQGKEVTPEQNKGLYQFGARLSQQYGFSGQEEKLGQLGDTAPTAAAVKRAEAIGAPPKVQPAQPITTNPDGSDLPQRVQAVGNKDPAAFIVHHTSGRGTVDSVLSTLKERGLGVQFVMDRDAIIHATGGSGAQNILAGWGPKGTGLNNSNIVGMEIIAKDDADVTPAQKAAFARFIAARYPTTPLYGHGEVNPGHKEADEGLSAKAAALAYREQLSSGQVAQATGAAPQAQPVTKGANGLYQNEKPQEFLSGKATTFATPEDIASGQDNGVGAPRLGKLDTTSVAGVAIPEEALRAKYGNNYAAWRRARVDVVDPQTGKRLRVPIVDLGPRGDLSAITDMTPTLSGYFGGDKNLMVKLVDNAGPDVTKNPQLFDDEQAAIRQGFDSSTLQPGVQKIAPKLGYSFKPVDPDRNTVLQQGFVQASKDAIAQLPEQKQSLPALINRLNQPIKGVPDAMRQNYQKAVQDEATKYAQDYYGIQDPKAAYAKMMSSPDVGTFFGEIKDKVLPYLNQAVTSFNQSAVTIDQNRLDMLAKAIHPEASPEARKTFINSIISEPDDVKRTIMINSSIGQLANENPNNPALAALNAGDIADSARRMADPEYQKRQQQEIARQVEANTRALRPDPRLQGTAAGWWADQFAQLPKNVIEGITGPFGQSLMLSEIYQGTVARLRQDNPGMSEDELKARAAGSTMAQIVPAEVLNRLAGGKLGGLTGTIENPVQRIGLSALAHVGLGAPIGVAQQVGVNVAEGKPITEGLLQAAGAGAVQAAPGAILSGVHPRPERAGVERTEAPPVTERPPITEQPHPVTEPVRPPVTESAQPPVPEAQPPPEVPKPPPVQAEQPPAQFEAASHNMRPLGYRAAVRLPNGEVFSGPEHADALDNASENGSIRVTDATTTYGFVGKDKKFITMDEADRILERSWYEQRNLPFPPEAPTVPITQEDVARRTYELGEERQEKGQPGTAADDYAQAQKELSQTKEPILPGTMSEAEPITSAIANRYVQERMATGELGQIDPSQGQSTEDMMQQGLQMSRTQRDGLIDNFMKGKGGDLDQQGAAIRSKEALFSEQARAASRAADADPTNSQLQAQAKAAADAVTAFHNGPIKKFKQVWSDSGRVLQREIPLDYTTFNGMKEAYLKGNNKEASAGLEPKLKQMADVVSKTADAERVAMNNLGKEIERQTTRRRLPTDEEVRARLMEIMQDLPCPGGAS